MLKFVFPIHKQGFTLIEILVVVTIMMVMMGGGLAAYNTFNEKQEMIQGTKKLISDLRLIQKKADSGEKPDGAACDELVRYAVTNESNPRTLTVLAECTDGINPATTIRVSTIKLGPGIVFDDDFNDDNVYSFSTGFGVLSRGLQGTDSQFFIRHTASGEMVRISVSPSGSINYEENP